MMSSQTGRAPDPVANSKGNYVKPYAMHGKIFEGDIFGNSLLMKKYFGESISNLQFFH